MQAEQRKLRVLYHEAATLLLTRVAVFLNRHINQFCEQRFGEMADFCMAWRYGGQGATIAANSVDAIMLFKLRQPAKLIQYLDSRSKAHLYGTWRYVPLRSYAASRGTHEGIHLLGCHLLAEHI